MINKQIRQFLEEIYQIDNSLRQHEDKLIKIINEFIKSRPDTGFDEQFSRELHQKLIAKAKELSSQPQSNLINLINQFKIMKKKYYTIGAAILLFLIIVPTCYYLNKEGKIADLGKTKLAYEPIITKLSDHAFGSLATQSQANLKTLEGGGGGSAQPATTVMQDEAIGRGGGGGVYSETSSATMPEVPAPERINYEFIYIGEDFILEQDKILVYKRMADAKISQQLLNNINKTNFGLVDLNKFKLSNADVTNFNVVEDREFGFSIYFNLMDSMVSINKNWQKWPNPTIECQNLIYPESQNCYDRYRLKYEDVPEDSKLIALANQFINDYGISRGNYGDPEILKYWQQEYLRASDKSMVYIPDSIPVIYPLIIEDKNVYSQGGEKSGITIEIDIRNNKAAGANNIISLNFASSEYEIETNSNTIIDVAKQGGYYPIYKQINPTKTITIKLGAPTQGLMEVWQYNMQESKSDILYIPALIFPIIEKSEENYYYSNNIVVPIAKEFLESRIDQPVLPEPVPLLEAEAEAIYLDNE